MENFPYFRFKIGDVVYDNERGVVDIIDKYSYILDAPYYKLRNLNLYQFEKHLEPGNRIQKLLWGKDDGFTEES